MLLQCAVLGTVIKKKSLTNTSAMARAQCHYGYVVLHTFFFSELKFFTDFLNAQSVSPTDIFLNYMNFAHDLR